MEAEHWGKPGFDTGGRNNTKGSQPASIMDGTIYISTKGAKRAEWDEQVQGIMPLSEDDRNGIIWLYKFIYEGLALEDCFFPLYELEDVPQWGLGCVPKYPLFFALAFHLEYDSVTIIKEDEGLDVNAQDADGLTALHHAILNGYTEVVETLLFRGLFRHRKDIDVNIKDAEGRTALHYAVLHSPESVVKDLLADKDIDVNIKDAGGHTALHHAVLHGLESVVKALLADKDIKPFLRDKQRRSALQIARENELERMIELLLAHPLTLPVRPQGKLATTWGALKSGR